MSDPQTYPDDDGEIDAEGIDPDMPSTNDERVVSDDDDEKGLRNVDNLGAEDNKGTPPTVPPTGHEEDDEDVLAEDPADH